MNFPSISFICTNAIAAFRRFPIAMTMAVVASVSAICYIELDYNQRNADEFLHKAILLSALGISFFIVLAVSLESWKINKRPSWAIRLSGLLLLTVYFFLLPESLFEAPAKHSIRLALFFVGSHLLVAIAPFLKSNQVNGFWQYNKTLFLRFLTAFLYSNVLYLGLTVALLSIDYLLGVDIKSERYGQLWIIILFIFNTWFFLSGIPDNFDNLNRKADYPRGLKFFTQYVLLPLVSVYMIILYLYAAKIIFNWSWPEGWVANLILSFSILGILSLLLLYPIRNNTESRWIQQFSKGYYLILLPLVGMLLLAVWRRISEYGFTENRYFVLIAGIWLGAIALYFLMSNRNNIKIIPASLVAIVLFISFGPWGAISISEYSQIQRLRSNLSANNILVDGQVQKSEHPVSNKDAVQISAGVRYLTEVHGLDGIQPWFEEDLEALGDTVNSVNPTTLASNVVELMGLKYTNSTSIASTNYQRFSSASHPSLHLDDFDWLIRNQRLSHTRSVSLDNVGSHNLILSFQTDSVSVSLSYAESNVPFITIDLQPVVTNLTSEFGSQNNYNVSPEQMTIEQENESAKVRLLLKNLHIKKQADKWKLSSLSTAILLRYK